MAAFDDWVVKRYGRPATRKQIAKMYEERASLRARMSELTRLIMASEDRWALRDEERERWNAVVDFIEERNRKKDGR